MLKIIKKNISSSIEKLYNKLLNHIE